MNTKPVKNRYLITNLNNRESYCVEACGVFEAARQVDASLTTKPVNRRYLVEIDVEGDVARTSEQSHKSDSVECFFSGEGFCRICVMPGSNQPRSPQHEPLIVNPTNTLYSAYFEKQRTDISIRIWDHILDTNFGSGADCLSLFDRTDMLISGKRFTLQEARSIATNIAPCVIDVLNLLEHDLIRQYNMDRFVVPFIFNELVSAIENLSALSSTSMKVITCTEANTVAYRVSERLKLL